MKLYAHHFPIVQCLHSFRCLIYNFSTFLIVPDPYVKTSMVTNHSMNRLPLCGSLLSINNPVRAPHIHVGLSIEWFILANNKITFMWMIRNFKKFKNKISPYLINFVVPFLCEHFVIWTDSWWLSNNKCRFPSRRTLVKRKRNMIKKLVLEHFSGNRIILTRGGV